jgi:hypothetical protein
MRKVARNNTWKTLEIKNSFKRKREFYFLSRNSNDTKLKNCDKSYCKILSQVIKEAKIYNYNSQILNKIITLKPP